MSVTREVREGIQLQSTGEAIAYTITTTPWGGSPTDVSVAAYDITESAYTVVTTTVFPAGSASVSGDVITLPKLRSLTADKVYHIVVTCTCAGNIVQPWFDVQGKTP